MKGIRVPEVLLGALLAFGMFAVGVVITVLWKGGASPDLGAPFGWISLFANLLVALGTLTLWVTTAATSRRQAWETVVSNRAYISVEPRGIRPLRGRPNAIGHVAIINVGRIPARNVSAKVVLQRGPRHFDPPNIPRGMTEGAKTIQPGVGVRQGSEENVPITEIDAGAPRRTGDASDEDVEAFLFVHGVVWYEDAFGKNLFTRFCHRYNIASRSSDRNPGDAVIDQERARYQERGNVADATPEGVE